MAGGPGVRARGARKGAREDGEGARHPQGRAVVRDSLASRRATGCAAILLVALACAGRQGPPGAPPPTDAGFRLLLRGESETTEGRTHFRLGVALRPPDHLRLEVFGAIGGPRLLVATDGVMAIAIVPQTRRYERGPADDRALERLTGLPIDPAGLVALLRGGKPCPGQGAPDPDPHDPGGSGARTCRYGDAKVVTTDGEDGWVESIRITLPGDAGAISLVRIEGPAAAPLGDALFAPTPPDGFAEGDLFRGPGRPLLLQEAGAARGEGG